MDAGHPSQQLAKIWQGCRTGNRLMNSRKLWAIVVIAALLLDVVLCWATSFSLHHFTWSLLLPAVAVRIASALVVGAFTGWLFCRMGRNLFASCLGLFASDLVWMKIVTGMGAPGAYYLLLNPLIVMVVLVCPVSASANRPRAFRIGLAIAVLVPLFFATWSLISIHASAGPEVRGTGLAQAVTVILAVGSIAGDGGGIVVAGCTIEVFERYFTVLSQASDKTVVKRVEDTRA
jgi:hypothetical protein